MKKIIFFFYITTTICIAQDLYVSNNANIFIYVDGAGFNDYDTTTNPNAATLFVTDDIELAGANSIIYLRNEAQLLQSGNVGNTGTGYLERGQRGTASLHNYNYWGSPVWSATNSYTIDDILFNGTDVNNVQSINWSTAYDADNSTNPITMSSYWLYAFDDNANDDYDAWEHRGESTSINHGLGFTMKGSGSGNGTQLQNYMFRGIPNNGTITNNLAPGNQTLVGNPYPSSIDAREFIRDNIPGGNPGTTTSIVGTLRFWRQSTTINTHYLAVYQGGYASLTLAGGVAATTYPFEISGSGDAGNANYTPGYYIPVAQGFFVDDDGDANTENIQFKNSQRFFKKEALGVSVFLEPNDEGDDNTVSSLEDDSVANSIDDDIQRIRLTYKTPEGAFRHLLLAFTQNDEATDDFDYGYDAKNNESLPSDLNWIIDGENYIIQGVGKFNIDKVYPLEMVLGEKGQIEISLINLENFENEIDVFVYDSFEKTYTKLNSIDYSTDLDAETYKDRFFITFKESNDTLDLTEETLNDIKINYLSESKNIFVSVPSSISVNQIQLMNVAGQNIKTWNSFNSQNNNVFKIPLRQVSEGVYVLKLLSDSGTVNKKVIVNQ